MLLFKSQESYAQDKDNLMYAFKGGTGDQSVLKHVVWKRSCLLNFFSP